MNKEDYFKIAILNKLYAKKDWVISAFSVTEDIDPENTAPKYPLSMVRQAGLPFAYNADNQLEKITGGEKAVPLFAFRDKIIATPDMCPTIDKAIETTRGRLLFNLIVLVNAFGKKMPYLNETIDIGSIEEDIAKRLEDTPENEEDRKPNVIYVDEYKNFINSLFYLVNFTQIAVWAITEKLITPPPGIDKVKKELMEKYKGQLDDPIILAKFESELLKLDTEHLKDDPGGEFFQYSNKSRKIVRKRLFLDYGAEKGLVDTVTRKPVTNSLNEGWKVEDMPSMIDALRAGSYNRGAETQLGGVLTKWLFRASTGIEIGDVDCGTQLGDTIKVNDRNYKNLINSYMMVSKGIILIEDASMAKSLIGKTIKIRSPLFCQTKDNNYCSICLGKGLSNNKDGISLSIAEIGSMFMLLKMKAMHGKALTTATIDLDLSLS